MACFASPLRGEVGAQRRVGSRTNQMLWAGLLTASAACYLLKLAGLSLPARLLQDARVQRTIPLVPIALLAALVATQTFSAEHNLVVGGRGCARVDVVVPVVPRAPSAR